MKETSLTNIKIMGKDTEFLHSFQEILENPNRLEGYDEKPKEGVLEELLKETSTEIHKKEIRSNDNSKDHDDLTQNVLIFYNNRRKSIKSIKAISKIYFVKSHFY